MENIVQQIENMGVDEKMIPFYDYGFPKEMINRISKLESPIESYNIDDLMEMSALELLKN